MFNDDGSCGKRGAYVMLECPERYRNGTGVYSQTRDCIRWRSWCSSIKWAESICNKRAVLLVATQRPCLVLF